MKHKAGDEDALIEAVLAALDHGDEQPATAGEEPPGEGQSRPFLETLGLLAYELEPVAPSAACRDRLLAQLPVQGQKGEVVPFRAKPAARWDPTGSKSPPWYLRPVWMHGLAASLLVAAMFLGAILLERGRELHQLQTVAVALGVEYCPLNPVGDNPIHPGARGAVYVAGDHQHWALQIQGLEPASPDESAYTLWFLTHDRPVRGGVLDFSSNGPVHLRSASMPPDIRAVQVTLENSDAVTEPSGPTVLYGDQMLPLEL